MSCARITTTLLSTTILCVTGIQCRSAKSQAELQREARITPSEARATALARVPNGTIEESELEEEDGKLVWSFDIRVPGTKDITEVHVDARTGVIAAVETETPKQQEREHGHE